jgi:hypothetical protein
MLYQYTNILEDLATFVYSLKMETARSSKMLVSYHNTTWHHNTEDLKLNVKTMCTTYKSTVNKTLYVKI